MTYAQVLASIRAALTLRPANTKVSVLMHEAAEKNILDYVEDAKALFTEKYNSPFNGSANTILSKAIKHFAVRELEDAALFYISSVVCGVFDGDSYNYEINIMQCGTNINDPDAAIPAFSFSSAEEGPLATAHLCELAEADGSGRYGNMVIDWSALTLGITYTCENYLEGALFAYALITTTDGGASVLRRESYVATAGQTIFTPSTFILTQNALVIINSSIQDDSTYTISGNTLTLDTGCTADDKVIILN